MSEEDSIEPVQVTPVSLDDFIGIYDTGYDTESLIDYHRHCEITVPDFGRRLDVVRDDVAVPLEFWANKFLNQNTCFYFDNISFENASRRWFEILAECVKHYVNEFQNLTNLELINDAPQVQKTVPGQGYHAWHCENSVAASFDRVLTTMMYLNEDFDAGETEWLYLSRREKPKTGRVVIWPAGFTHTHRGNPPIGGNKYIATSWIRNLRVL